MCGENIRQERKKIYKKIDESYMIGKTGLIFSLLPEKGFESILSTLITNYIKTNIYYFFNEKNVFEKSLEDLTDKIMQLPNLTPGGAIYPKNESGLIFTEICKTIYIAFEDFFKLVELIDLPTIRFKHGDKNKYPKRPYATDKIHSDAWVGQHGDGIFSYCVLGDTENTGVEFFYPKKIKENFLEKLDNYELGVNRFSDLEKICEMEQGKAIVFDHLILHKTNNDTNGGPRISIDFGLKIKSDITQYREINNADFDRWEFYPVSVLEELCTSKFISPNESIIELQEKLKKGIPPCKRTIMNIR